MEGVCIAGTGSFVPERILKNDELSLLVDTNDEWISTRTGIKERRISEGDNTSDIASKAAINALESSGINAEDIDLLIVATVTPDNFIPSTACMVQHNIGAVNAACFDISVACSGFVYAMNIAEQFIKTGQYSKALIIGAEVLSKIIDWKDRGTCILFGDGAGAAVLTKSIKNGIISSYLGSDGSKSELLKSEALPVENLYKKDAVCKRFLSMNGREVFKFGVKIIPDSIEKVLKNTGYSIDDIKYIVPHQANCRIVEAAAKKLGIDENKFYVNLNKFGNTSAASIPIALDEMVRTRMLKSKDKIILVGFGGGLTWGSVLVEWV